MLGRIQELCIKPSKCKRLQNSVTDQQVTWVPYKKIFHDFSKTSITSKGGETILLVLTVVSKFKILSHHEDRRNDDRE